VRRSGCQRRRLPSRGAKHPAVDCGRGSEPLAAKQPIATGRRGIFDKDEPFAKTKDLIAGFAIIEVKAKEAAIERARL